MKPRKFYSQTANVYDFRHESPTTKFLRKFEGKVIERFANGLTLDAGCGTGTWLEYATIGMDISEKMLKNMNTEKPLVQGNVECIPFRNGFFETILCMFSVLNICDFEKSIREFSRTVKKNGRVIISAASIWDKDYSLNQKLKLKRKDYDGKLVKTGLYKKFYVSGKHTRMKLFTKEELIEYFEKNGFVMEFFDSVYSLQKPHWNNFKKFTPMERIRLFLERILPYKDFGCFYVMVFRKIW